MLSQKNNTLSNTSSSSTHSPNFHLPVGEDREYGAISLKGFSRDFTRHARRNLFAAGMLSHRHPRCNFLTIQVPFKTTIWLLWQLICLLVTFAPLSWWIYKLLGSQKKLRKGCLNAQEGVWGDPMVTSHNPTGVLMNCSNFFVFVSAKEDLFWSYELILFYYRNRGGNPKDVRHDSWYRASYEIICGDRRLPGKLEPLYLQRTGPFSSS